MWGQFGQTVCHTNEGSREARTDYIIANTQLLQAIRTCYVDNTSGFLTHRPLAIEIDIGKLARTTRRLVKPTNFADLLEETVKTTLQEKLDEYQVDNKDIDSKDRKDKPPQ